MTTLYTTSFKGIGQVTVRELRSQFGNRLSKIRTSRVRDYDLVQFNWRGDPLGLRQLGTVEDVFCWLADIPLTGKRDDLTAIADLPDLTPALHIHRQFNGLPKGRTKYRVIVQAAMQQSYRRNQMQNALERALRSSLSQMATRAGQCQLGILATTHRQARALGLAPDRPHHAPSHVQKCQSPRVFAPHYRSGTRLAHPPGRPRHFSRSHVRRGHHRH